MSFENDFFKIEKTIQPQCKICEYFKNENNNVYCLKRKNIDLKYLTNEEKCNFKK